MLKSLLWERATLPVVNVITNLEIRIVPCDRGITRVILEKLIDSKVKHLFKTENMKLARLFHCLCVNGGFEDLMLMLRTPSCLLDDFKKELRWDENVDGQDRTAPWIDRSEVSILAYGSDCK